MPQSPDMIETQKVFVHQFEAAVLKVEGVIVVLRVDPAERLDVMATQSAAYLPRKGQRGVRPATKGNGDAASRKRRLGTIANRIRNMLPEVSFVLHDPENPNGWADRLEFNSSRRFKSRLDPQQRVDVELRHRAPGEQ